MVPCFRFLLNSVAIDVFVWDRAAAGATRLLTSDDATPCVAADYDRPATFPSLSAERRCSSPFTWHSAPAWPGACSGGALPGGTGPRCGVVPEHAVVPAATGAVEAQRDQAPRPGRLAAINCVRGTGNTTERTPVGHQKSQNTCRHTYSCPPMHAAATA